MNKVKATVIIPTTIDRGMLLPYSVGSIQNQTIQDIEIFIIGDGVYDETREVIYDLQSKDERIRFFDHPKHERRGEIYRHMALQEAKGEIICYLCDRDLMLPDHISAHFHALQTYDFSSSLYIRIHPNGNPRLDHYFRYLGDARNFSPDLTSKTGGLSMIAHTKSCYDRLPYGWRTTPADKPTDAHMWEQFMEQPFCKAYAISIATILYFKRQLHPGWPALKRLPALIEWYKILDKPLDLEHIQKMALLGLIDEANSIRRQRDNLKKQLDDLKNSNSTPTN